MVYAVVTFCALLCRDVELPHSYSSRVACFRNVHTVQAAAANAMRPGERIEAIACRIGEPA
jgi:hypothetical protein